MSNDPGRILCTKSILSRYTCPVFKWLSLVQQLWSEVGNYVHQGGVTPMRVGHVGIHCLQIPSYVWSLMIGKSHGNVSAESEVILRVGVVIGLLYTSVSRKTVASNLTTIIGKPMLMR